MRLRDKEVRKQTITRIGDVTHNFCRECPAHKGVGSNNNYKAYKNVRNKCGRCAIGQELLQLGEVLDGKRRVVR